jgi:hypothetical protein
MRKGLFKNLALAAPLVVCLPLCAQAGGAATPGDEPAAKIFEDYSLTSSTDLSGDSKVVNTNASLEVSPPPPAHQMALTPVPSVASPGAAAGTPCTSPVCTAPPNCCNSLGEPFANPACVFNAGVEATIFHVQTKGMSADSAVTSFFGERDTTFEQGNSQVYDQVTFSPRIWAGVQQDCYGIEGRFWYLSDSTNRLQPFETAPPFTGQYTMDRIKAYTVDLEGTYSLCYCGNKIVGFAGARYASFEAGQGIDITRDTIPLTEQFTTSAFSKFTFNGTGITAGFLGRTPLGCDGCLNAVYGVRGSFLWGDAGRDVQTQAGVINNNGAATSVNSATADSADTAFIVEALIGIEWDHQLTCMPMCAFLRLGAEFQYWDMGDNGQVSSTSFAISNTGSAVSRASIGDVDTYMYGLTVATGFTW